jgi:hypothetical protein
MSSKPLGLVAVLIFWAGLSMPSQSPAETITGTWTGAVYFDIEYAVNGQLVGESSGSYIGEMSLTYDPLDDLLSISISGVQGLQVIGSPYPSDPFGPTGGAAMVLGSPISYYGPAVGNVAVSYRSILPDGAIDTSSGFADGDIFEIAADPGGTGEAIHVDFQTLPEPPSIVTAASALLITASIGLKRRLRRRQGAVRALSTHT